MAVSGRPHTHAPHVLEEVAAIRTHGRRLTRQRALIWDALVRAGGRHLSAREVAETVHGRAPELHQATIYRTLDVFVADGLVRRTDFGDGRAVYELAAEHRHDQGAERVDRRAADTDLEVEVRPGRVARRSDQPDERPARDPVADAQVDG